MLADAKKLMDEAKKAMADAKVFRDSVESEAEVLKDYRKTKDLMDSVTDAEKDLIQRKQEALTKHNELVRWENSLVDIETRQKTKEESLKTREIAQAKREIEYKEILKKEFFDELNKKLQ